MWRTTQAMPWLCMQCCNSPHECDQEGGSLQQALQLELLAHRLGDAGRPTNMHAHHVLSAFVYRVEYEVHHVCCYDLVKAQCILNWPTTTNSTATRGFAITALSDSNSTHPDHVLVCILVAQDAATCNYSKATSSCPSTQYHHTRPAHAVSRCFLLHPRHHNRRATRSFCQKAVTPPNAGPQAEPLLACPPHNLAPAVLLSRKHVPMLPCCSHPGSQQAAYFHALLPAAALLFMPWLVLSCPPASMRSLALPCFSCSSFASLSSLALPCCACPARAPAKPPSGKPGLHGAALLLKPWLLLPLYQGTQEPGVAGPH